MSTSRNQREGEREWRKAKCYSSFRVMLANKPIAPYCRPFAVQSEREKQRLGGSW